MAIKFGSEVYTWFMDGYGDGNNNKLPHMMKIISQAGFTGIEPMVLEPYDTYWMGDCKDPAKLKDALDEAGIELAALALICKWDGEEETESERIAADWTIETLKLFPGAALGTVPLPDGRHSLQQRRLNLVNNVNRVSRRAADAGLKCSFHPNSPPASLVRTQYDYDVVLSSLDPAATGWTPDVGHIIRGGMDIIGTMTKWQHLVNHIHYKDFSGNGPRAVGTDGFAGQARLPPDHRVPRPCVTTKAGSSAKTNAELAITQTPTSVTLQNGQWCQENLAPLVG